MNVTKFKTERMMTAFARRAGLKFATCISPVDSPADLVRVVTRGKVTLRVIGSPTLFVFHR